MQNDAVPQHVNVSQFFCENKLTVNSIMAEYTVQSNTMPGKVNISVSLQHLIWPVVKYLSWCYAYMLNIVWSLWLTIHSTL